MAANTGSLAGVKSLGTRATSPCGGRQGSRRHHGASRGTLRSRASANDRALVHGDVGLHNLAFDPQSDTINGIFDYDGAAWADRHNDFRYLLFDVAREDMLDSALEVYEPATGREICAIPALIAI